jgi:hypothetical protein
LRKAGKVEIKLEKEELTGKALITLRKAGKQELIQLFPRFLISSAKNHQPLKSSEVAEPDAVHARGLTFQVKARRIIAQRLHPKTATNPASHP